LVLGQVSPADNSEFFRGLADEVDLFDRALSPAEIQWIYNAGSAGKYQPSSGSASVNVGTALAITASSSLGAFVSASTAGVPVNVAAMAGVSSANVASGTGSVRTVPFKRRHNAVSNVAHTVTRIIPPQSRFPNFAGGDGLFARDTGRGVFDVF
jgi:hypothetical protein